MSGWRKRTIMEMAHEAGFEGNSELTWEGVICTEELEAFAKLVREDEREECAKVCEDALTKIWEYHSAEVKSAAGNVCTNLATAIRARGTHEI